MVIYDYSVSAVPFLAVLERLEAVAPLRPWIPATKTAEVRTGPRSFFVHVRVPDGLADRLREVQRQVIPDVSRHQDIDHVTLVHVPRPRDGEHPPAKVEAALEGLRAVGAEHPPIKARIQGWGYFDGASRDGDRATALVALLDAPGLEHLHVGMVNALRSLGVEPSKGHVFAPHVTLGYLEQHGRSDKPLPPLSGNFTINKVHVAARDVHEIPLTGGLGMLKAAAARVVADVVLHVLQARGQG